MNAKRFEKSNERMCMPSVPEEMFVEAIKELVKVEEAWIPTGEENLYTSDPLCMQMKLH